MASVRLGGEFKGVNKSGGDGHDVLVSLGIVVADIKNDGLSIESLAFLKKRSKKYRNKIMSQLHAGVQNSGAKKFTPN